MQQTKKAKKAAVSALNRWTQAISNARTGDEGTALLAALAYGVRLQILSVEAVDLAAPVTVLTYEAARDSPNAWRAVGEDTEIPIKAIEEIGQPDPGLMGGSGASSGSSSGGLSGVGGAAEFKTGDGKVVNTMSGGYILRN